MSDQVPQDMTAAPRRLRGGWYESSGARGYVLARRWPPRFDVSATGRFPPARRGRLARQIRQDLWRRFQGLRGFSPVIQIAYVGDGLIVRAGGRLEGRVPRSTESLIQDLLDSPRHRARWLTWAGQAT